MLNFNDPYLKFSYFVVLPIYATLFVLTGVNLESSI